MSTLDTFVVYLYTHRYDVHFSIYIYLYLPTEIHETIAYKKIDKIVIIIQMVEKKFLDKEK